MFTSSWISLLTDSNNIELILFRSPDSYSFHENQARTTAESSSVHFRRAETFNQQVCSKERREKEFKKKNNNKTKRKNLFYSLLEIIT